MRCVDNALGFTGTNGIPAVGTLANQIPVQGNLVRNLIEGADLVMSHITHFYHLTALDYINTDHQGTLVDDQPYWSNAKDNTADMVTGATAQLLVNNYVTALNIRREAHRMAAYASGKQPCTPVLIPGGVTKTIDANMGTSMQTILTSIRSFIDNTYVPNVVTVAKAFSGNLLIGSAGAGVGAGCKKYLAYGTFPNSAGTLTITGGFLDATAGVVVAAAPQALQPQNIQEHIKYSYYDEGALGGYNMLHPSVGVTKPSFSKGGGAYSWLKAPRYQTGTGSGNTHVCEVGPLARVLVNYKLGLPPFVDTVNEFITGTGPGGLGADLNTVLNALPSVLGRHAARALEAKIVADSMDTWIGLLSPNVSGTMGTTYRHRNIPTASSTGYGLTEAPRGALGHWIRIDGTKISNYQCVVPTTWNASPKDSYGQMGTMELAISGTVLTDDATGRTKVGRIVRSFDPCIACAVHIVTPDNKTISKFEIVPHGAPECSCK